MNEAVWSVELCYWIATADGKYSAEGEMLFIGSDLHKARAFVQDYCQALGENPPPQDKWLKIFLWRIDNPTFGIAGWDPDKWKPVSESYDMSGAFQNRPFRRPDAPPEREQGPVGMMELEYWLDNARRCPPDGYR